MKFKQILGIIFLACFLGMMGYKLMDTLSGQSWSSDFLLLFFPILLIIGILVRKVLVDS